MYLILVLTHAASRHKIAAAMILRREEALEL